MSIRVNYHPDTVVFVNTSHGKLTLMAILSKQQHNASSNGVILSRRVAGFATMQTIFLNKVAAPIMHE